MKLQSHTGQVAPQGTALSVAMCALSCAQGPDVRLWRSMQAAVTLADAVTKAESNAATGGSTP